VQIICGCKVMWQSGNFYLGKFDCQIET